MNLTLTGSLPNLSKLFSLACIATQNCLHQVFQLSSKLRYLNLDAPVFVCVVDDSTNAAHFAGNGDGINWVSVSDLALPETKRFLFSHQANELCWALKPYLLEYLLKKTKAPIIYLDSDVLLLKPLHEAEVLLQDQAILLTPHFLSSGTRKDPRAVETLQHGEFNAGFLGLSYCQTSLNFLNWWKEKLLNQCLNDFSRSLAADQGWLDLVPSRYQGVKVMENPGYNVGYWNLAERNLDDLTFFHFSGFDLANRQQLSRYRPEVVSTRLQFLIEDYADSLLLNGASTWRIKDYGYAKLYSGERIDLIFRELIRTNCPELRNCEDPFQLNAKDFWKIAFKSDRVREYRSSIRRQADKWGWQFPFRWRAGAIRNAL